MKSYRLCSFKKEWLNNEALLLSLSRVQFLSDSRTLEKKPLSPYEVTPPFKEEHFYFLFRFFGGSIYLFCLRFYVQVNSRGYDETVSSPNHNFDLGKSNQ